MLLIAPNPSCVIVPTNKKILKIEQFLSMCNLICICDSIFHVVCENFYTIIEIIKSKLNVITSFYLICRLTNKSREMRDVAIIFFSSARLTSSYPIDLFETFYNSILDRSFWREH